MQFSLEKVLLLKNITAFSGVSESALSDFLYATEEKAFSKGSTILKKGDFNSSLYILLRGRIQVLDKDSILSELSGQEIFGEITALDPSVIDVDVKAIEETLVLKISSENLYEIMALHPNIEKGIIKMLASRLKVLDNRHI